MRVRREYVGRIDAYEAKRVLDKISHRQEEAPTVALRASIMRGGREKTSGIPDIDALDSDEGGDAREFEVGHTSGLLRLRDDSEGAFIESTEW